MKLRGCPDCLVSYSGRVSCPECGHIPKRDRLDYEPPEPCEPWQADLDFPDASINMTVRHEGQRRLVHRMVRIFGGGPTNA